MTTTAKIITDNLSQEGIRLITMQWRYPKFIHGEVMTHRAFSRNASSSRAIPVERLIKDVIDDPALPVFWGKNQPGMQAAEELDDIETPFIGLDGTPVTSRATARAIWLRSRDLAVRQAESLQKIGAHKQLVNRLIEPFCHINVVVTATEWNNFFAVRRHADAQPEIHALADAAREAMSASTPTLLKPGQWHLPYVDTDEIIEDGRLHDLLWKQHKAGEFSEGAIDQLFDRALIKLSVARCARVSYLTHEGKPPNIEDDLKLYDRLVGSVPLHASPCEHQASPDVHISHTPWRWKEPQHHGNFNGWIQFRKTLPNENVT